MERSSVAAQRIKHDSECRAVHADFDLVIRDVSGTYIRRIINNFSALLNTVNHMV